LIGMVGSSGYVVGLQGGVLAAAAALTFRCQHAHASVYELASKDCKAIL
jgi:hypothetical protein